MYPLHPLIAGASSSGAALWGGITIQAARNARLSLDDTVKLFFAEGVGSYDAGTHYINLYISLSPQVSLVGHTNVSIKV